MSVRIVGAATRCMFATTLTRTPNNTSATHSQNRTRVHGISQTPTLETAQQSTHFVPDVRILTCFSLSLFTGMEEMASHSQGKEKRIAD